MPAVVPAVLDRLELFEKNPIPMWIYDVRTLRFLEVNAAALARYGYTRDEMLAMTIADIRPPEDVPALLEQVGRVETGLRSVGTWRHRRRDGETLHVEIVVHDLEWDGRVARLACAYDVSAHVDATAGLRRHGAILQAVGYAAARFLGEADWEPAIPSVLRRLGEAADVSRAYLFTVDEIRVDDVVFTQRHEWAAAHASSEILNDTMHKMSFRDEGFELWIPELLAGRTVRAHVRELPPRMQTFLGAQAIRTLFVVPIHVESVLWGFLGFDEVRRERDWSEAELETLRTAAQLLGAAVQRRILERQFLQAQKLEAIGLLASGVAHDFNNVLAIVFAHSGLAQRVLRPEDTELAEHLAEIQQASRRAAALTRQLLTFSRADLAATRAFDVNPHVTEVARLARSLLGEHIHVELALAPDAGGVRMDPVQLEQILVNLAVNARDAMPDGGTLTITTARRVRADGHLVVDVTVRDTGHGMTAEVRDRAFEPFFTTKPPGKGTGLGLAMVRRTVLALDGDVQVESTPGAGTTVVVTLPAAEPGTTGALDPTDADAPRGRRQHVLLVEDDDDLREAFARILGDHGYRVTSARNAETAIVSLEAAGERVHAIVTDVSMPGMSGLALARRARELRPGLPILLCTGFADDASRGADIAASGLPVLRKPFEAAALLYAVASLVADPDPPATDPP